MVIRYQTEVGGFQSIALPEGATKAEVEATIRNEAAKRGLVETSHLCFALPDGCEWDAENHRAIPRRTRGRT
jgi:hypothetical protein